MKKRKPLIIIALLAAFLMSVLNGCARSVPYLNQRERASIENELFSSLRIEEIDPTNHNLQVEFRNTTNHDLEDVCLKYPERASSNTDISLASVPQLKGSEQASLTVGSPNKVSKAGDEVQLYLKYTVGAYTYYSAERTVTVGGEGLRDLQIFIETKNGRIPLNMNGSVEFETGKEIQGLDTAAIYSLKTTANAGAGGYQLLVEVTGDEPTGDGYPELCYKLIDSDGVLYESSTLYFIGKNTATCYFNSMRAIPPGEYVLRFKEYR